MTFTAIHSSRQFEWTVGCCSFNWIETNNTIKTAVRLNWQLERTTSAVCFSFQLKWPTHCSQNCQLKLKRMKSACSFELDWNDFNPTNERTPFISIADWNGRWKPLISIVNRSKRLSFISIVNWNKDKSRRFVPIDNWNGRDDIVRFDCLLNRTMGVVRQLTINHKNVYEFGGTRTIVFTVFRSADETRPWWCED